MNQGDFIKINSNLKTTIYFPLVHLFFYKYTIFNFIIFSYSKESLMTCYPQHMRQRAHSRNSSNNAISSSVSHQSITSTIVSVITILCVVTVLLVQLPIILRIIA